MRQGGAFAGGVFGRQELGAGFALLGGIASVEEDYRAAALDGSALGAVALRYVRRNGVWRPFAEIGGWRAPNTDIEFTRAYANGGGAAIGRASTEGSLSYLYARGGIAFAPRPADELAVFIEYGRERLKTDAYAETVSQENPFEAAFAAAADEIDIARVGARYTRAFSQRLDATFWAQAAAVTDRTSSLSAQVSGVGGFAPGDQDEPSWAEYGVRAGWRIGDRTTLDAFVSSTSGDGVGSNTQAGLALRLKL